MSAAATAAGYLYASGRLRGRGTREHEEHPTRAPEQQKPAPRERVRVAVLPEPQETQPYEAQPHETPEKPRRTPKIEYRTRKRWTAA